MARAGFKIRWAALKQRHGRAYPDPDGAAEECLDDLAVREAIIGHGLVLTEVESAEVDSNDLLLHAVDAGHVRPIGVFRDAADAWEAIDVVDDAAAGRRSSARIRSVS
jgi:hypothetical protein